MKDCVLVVLSNPVPGREDEYNAWYTNQHLADVLKVPGFKSARRFTLALPDSSNPWQYLAIYEFQADDPAVAMAALMACAGSPDMVLSEAMDMNAYSAVPWVAICDQQVAA